MAVKHAVMEPIRHAVNASPASYTFGEAAGQTFKKGAAVKLVAGLVTEITSGTDVSTSYVGVAAEPAKGVTSNPIRVEPFFPAQRFQASLVNTKDDGTVTDTGARALAVADIGAVFAIVKDPTTLRHVLTSDVSVATAQTLAVVVALVDPVGATSNDTPNFGSANTGKALVEFVVVGSKAATARTILG